MSRARVRDVVQRIGLGLTLVTGLVAGASRQAAGQAVGMRVVRGRVLAADGAPLADVIVRASAGERGEVGTAVTRSGSTGVFTLRVPSAGATVVAARIGFAPETVAVGPRESAITVRLRPAPLVLSPMLVRGERSFSAASSSVIREVDIALRPRESSQELLRLVPGLVIAQHAGGGKAEQIFLRGFDADHGTDLAVTVDGTPVNMVSHAHGQGYADLHFLMPEVVDRADVRKGPYDVRDGDFATAGAVAFRTKDRIDGPEASVRRGSFNTEHVLVMAPVGGDAAHAGGYVAVSGHHTDGPFDRAQDYGRVNAFGKWTAPVGSVAQLVATASAFGARWNASGEIPSRAVAEGLIDRFGSLDPSEGGRTQRYDASIALRSISGMKSWEARLWATRYQFQLFSDFTFFLVDSVNGDGIEQADDRTASGASVRYGQDATLLGHAGSWEVGAAARTDLARVGLFHQKDRERLAEEAVVRTSESSIAPWARYMARLTPRVRLELGARGDVYRFDVRDGLGTGGTATSPHPNGVRTRGIVSPKASLAVDATDGTTLFANVGAGFHSNDARDVVLAPRGAEVLPRAMGAELGARHTWTGGSVAAAVWGLDLQSELVWSGDEGTTEARGRTRRMGLDLEGRAQLRSWLWADADVDLARGRFRDEPAGANLIPLAPTVTATAGLTVRDAGALEGGVRMRHVGGRAANENDSVHAFGYTLGELFGSYSLGRVRLVGTVDNLFDAAWNEAQFATTSRLRGEPAPVTELHFTPGAPRSMQIGAEWRY